MFLSSKFLCNILIPNSSIKAFQSTRQESVSNTPSLILMNKAPVHHMRIHIHRSTSPPSLQLTTFVTKRRTLVQFHILSFYSIFPPLYSYSGKRLSNWLWFIGFGSSTEWLELISWLGLPYWKASQQWMFSVSESEHHI